MKSLCLVSHGVYPDAPCDFIVFLLNPLSCLSCLDELEILLKLRVKPSASSLGSSLERGSSHLCSPNTFIQILFLGLEFPLKNLTQELLQTDPHSLFLISISAVNMCLLSDLCQLRLI